MQGKKKDKGSTAKQTRQLRFDKGTTGKEGSIRLYRSGDMINAFVLDECIIDFLIPQNLAPSGSTKSQKTWNYHNKIKGTRMTFANKN